MKTWEEISAESRKDSERAARIEAYKKELRDEIREYRLSELRKLINMTQAELAERLEMEQPGVSRLERQNDMLLSTLRSFVAALGGDLEINAVFDDVRVKIAS